MAKFTKEMVTLYADKLLIGLTDEENKMVLDEFEIIDNTINTINEIKEIQELEPMTHALDDFVYELREDEAEESIPIDDALRNAGRVDGREIEIPKVVSD